MKKEYKNHLIYACVLLVVISGILYYQYVLNQETRFQFEEKTNLLENQINVFKEEINTELRDLKNKDEELSSSVTSAKELLGDEIKGLSGELQTFKTESGEQVAALEESITKVKLQNEDFSAIIELVVPGVVSIITDVGSGSGFIINKEGYIVTNNHVINGARAATIITSDGKEHAVYLVGKNSAADLAVLRINASDLTVLSFANSNRAKVGEKVIAVGNPGGLKFTVTQGIVSALNRDDPAGNKYIQIDVPINPGNSGGPLINVEGKVLGVNTLKLLGYEGVGFALTSNYVQEIIDQIIDQ